MTITSAGTPRFHLKPIISVLAATAIVAATIVVAQQVGRDTAPAPIEIATAVPVHSAASYPLAQALADGKLDAGLIPAASQPTPKGTPDPQTVTVLGQGALIDALINGKFTSDWQSRDSGVQYVSGGEAPSIAGGLWGALESGKLDAGLGDSESAAQTAPPATYMPTIAGGHQE